VSCIYIGVPTELSYIKSPITKDNINTYFSVLNGNDYYFNWNNNALISTNNNVEGIATTTLTARMDINLVFDWSVSSEPDYDVFTIRIDKNDGTSEIIIEASGEQNGTNTCSLQSDDSITFLYEKDSS